LTFIYGDVQEKDEIPLPHQEVFNLVEMGDKLYLDDGRIELEVEIVTDDDFLAKVITGGKIQSFKGFSKAHHVDNQHEISEKDLSFIKQTYQYEQVGYAMSFIRSPEEVLLIRKHTRHKPLVCKVERLKTFENLKSIAMYSNGMWLCRGDLGIEANIYNLYEFEKIFVQKLRTLGKPYLIAGQVLEHMVQNRQPSRSEVAHLGYLLEGGFNGVVLSDETAIGKFPAQVVKFCKNFFNHFQQLAEGQLN
jgi:pyruvate kinase